MNSYWKLGCNWGHNKPDFYEVIRDRKIIICAGAQMTPGDWVLICRGHTCVALAKIGDEPFPCTSDAALRIPFTEKEISYDDDNCIAHASEFYELLPDEQFLYQLQQGICHVKDRVVIENTMAALKKVEDRKMLTNATQLLREKKNIILQGAPGTGKTYNTAALALSILGLKDVDLSNHAEVMARYEELRQQGRIFFTTFHQSMDYEDFVEGIKPKIDDKSQVTYQIEEGIFKNVCKAADSCDIIKYIDKYIRTIKGYENRKQIPTLSGRSSLYVWWKEGNSTLSTRSVFSTATADEDSTPSPLNIEKVKQQAVGEGIENNWQQYAQAFINAVRKEYGLDTAKNGQSVVLIIDEINRGNVSRIFGELITLLEADKRIGATHPVTVTLPYSKEPFGVPNNVYLIGTMNTTDRSTGTLDYAIRRRFAFVTLESDVNAVKHHYEAAKIGSNLGVRAVTVFNDVLSFVEAHNAGDVDVKDLMVGHSYFMADDEESLKRRIEYEVIPLVKEYVKDGILTAKPEDAQRWYSAWKSLSAHGVESTQESLGESEMNTDRQ